MNAWNIPDALEKEVRVRDKCCVYCGVLFDKKVKKNSPTWEHIINDARIVTRENIALCCCGCNASKGAKLLERWMSSSYCSNKNITVKTVAPVIKKALRKKVT
jgi:5-methylcytosine-specific restriction endonuclease McrA